MGARCATQLHHMSELIFAVRSSGTHPVHSGPPSSEGLRGEDRRVSGFFAAMSHCLKTKLLTDPTTFPG